MEMLTLYERSICCRRVSVCLSVTGRQTMKDAFSQFTSVFPVEIFNELVLPSKATEKHLLVKDLREW